MTSDTRPHPAPNVPECTCDRDDDSWVGEPVDMPLCPYHEKRLRHLSWESLACMVIDYEAALRATPVADTAGIDAAWREAEAALPEGWRIVQVRRHFTDPNEGLWTAVAASVALAEKDGGEFDYTASEQSTGDSPAASLLALAADLRARHA